MKKLHIFILKSYLGPLLMTFLISLFILVMQFLWKYVDDMVGKGLEWYVLAELLFYASVQVVPMALPLAILLASLMTFGTLGENYELTALKAAGISLLRIMLPLIIFTIMLCVGAFYFSNKVMPYANLKLYSLLYDVKQARPEMDIKERVFYDGIDKFSIKIGRKSKESNMLYDLMIYDHRDRKSPSGNVTLADSGKIMIAKSNGYMKLILYNGVRYDENVNTERGGRNRKDKGKYQKDVFKEQEALIELEGFDFSRTDESLFKSNDRMKDIAQIEEAVDSFIRKKEVHLGRLQAKSERFYFNQIRSRSRSDSTALTRSQKLEQATPIMIDTLFDQMKGRLQEVVVETAIRNARDKKSVLDEQLINIESIDKKIRRHNMEWHRKFTLAFACFVFFFIGAPLGAIIRKGGLGLPVVISVVFFIIYYVVDTSGGKMAREGMWHVYQGMWLSSFVLFPIGVFLTYKAVLDSALLNADAYIIFFRKVAAFFMKRKSK